MGFKQQFQSHKASYKIKAAKACMDNKITLSYLFVQCNPLYYVIFSEDLIQLITCEISGVERHYFQRICTITALREHRLSPGKVRFTRQKT